MSEKQHKRARRFLKIAESEPNFYKILTMLRHIDVENLRQLFSIIHTVDHLFEFDIDESGIEFDETNTQLIFHIKQPNEIFAEQLKEFCNDEYINFIFSVTAFKMDAIAEIDFTKNMSFAIFYLLMKNIIYEKAN